MSGVLGRPRPPSAKLADPTAIHTLHCSRCEREIDSRAISMECFGCVQAAQAIWPGAQPIAGEMSGS